MQIVFNVIYIFPKSVEYIPVKRFQQFLALMQIIVFKLVMISTQLSLLFIVYTLISWLYIDMINSDIEHIWLDEIYGLGRRFNDTMQAEQTCVNEIFSSIFTV